MAIILFPAYGEMRNSIGGTTYTRSASGKQVARARVKPINPRTNAQVLTRQQLGAASANFTVLTSFQQAAWNSFAKNYGVKYGRWEYVKRTKELATCNSSRAYSASGITETSQPILDRVTLLDDVNNNIADFLITSGTASKAGYTVTPSAIYASTNSLDFEIALIDTTKNFTIFQNSSTQKLALQFSIVVRKKQSKYERVFVSLTSMTQTPAANKMTLTDVIPTPSPTDYKYNLQEGDVVTVRCYVIDPSAMMERFFVSETQLIVQT